MSKVETAPIIMDPYIDYTTPTPRFSVTNETTLNEGIAYLSEHGYVVISDVMSQDEIEVNKNLLWKFLAEATNGSVDRDDPDTWSNQWQVQSSRDSFEQYSWICYVLLVGRLPKITA